MTPKVHSSIFICLILAFAVAALRVHLRIKTTLTGYHIGKLKVEESRLLKDKSLLTMKLAKITTRKNLIKLSKFPTQKNRKLK